MSDNEIQVSAVHGDKAIEYALGLRHDAPITLDEYGFCCDTGNYRREDQDTDRETFFWELLLYRNQPERFTLEFIANRWGTPDFKHPVRFTIETGDDCEWSRRVFNIGDPIDDEDY